MARIEAESFYKRVQSALFSRISSKFSYPIAASEPHCVFIIEKEFSDLTKFLVYDFIISLYQIYGREIVPKQLVKGCAKLTLSFPDTKDYKNVDFRQLIMHDEDYHAIFQRFSVDRIFVHEFPPELSRPLIDKTRFKLNSYGIPQPY